MFTSSSDHTLILPIKKGDKMDSDGNQIYQVVQGLRAIKSFVIPPYPVIPNPATT